MELESLYCLYSYQYLNMPYSKNNPSFTFDFSKYKDCGVLIDKSFISDFIKILNESIIYKASIRDVKIENEYIIKVFGFPSSECNSNYFKKTVAEVNEKLDALYLKHPQSSKSNNRP